MKQVVLSTYVWASSKMQKRKTRKKERKENEERKKGKKRKEKKRLAFPEPTLPGRSLVWPQWA